MTKTVRMGSAAAVLMLVLAAYLSYHPASTRLLTPMPGRSFPIIFLSGAVIGIGCAMTILGDVPSRLVRRLGTIVIMALSLYMLGKPRAVIMRQGRFRCPTRSRGTNRAGWSPGPARERSPQCASRALGERSTSPPTRPSTLWCDRESVSPPRSKDRRKASSDCLRALLSSPPPIFPLADPLALVANNAISHWHPTHHGSIRTRSCVRSLFLPSPGQGPNRARAARMEKDHREPSAPTFSPRASGVQPRLPGPPVVRATAQEISWLPKRST